MKSLYLLSLLFLSACSTTPKLALRPQPPAPLATNTVRYPEMVRAYYFGRYVDPNDDMVMHEQHTVYRAEENTRWNLQPSPAATIGCAPISAPDEPCDAAFSPLPVNDAVLAEVNAQKLATTQIIAQSRILSSALSQFETALAQTRSNLQETAALHTSINIIQHRLDALESASKPSQVLPFSTTNSTPDPLSP